MTVHNLRESCRTDTPEPWEREGQGQPFRFDARSADAARVRLWVGNNPDEPCCEVFSSSYGVTLYADAVRWVPILEAMLAKCKQVAGKTDPPADPAAGGTVRQDGPGVEDGPWAAGWEERSQRAADPAAGGNKSVGWVVGPDGLVDCPDIGCERRFAPPGPGETCHCACGAVCHGREREAV